MPRLGELSIVSPECADSFLIAESTGADLSVEVLAKAEAGMAEMSEKFRERGGEIYIPTAE